MKADTTYKLSGGTVGGWEAVINGSIDYLSLIWLEITNFTGAAGENIYGVALGDGVGVVLDSLFIHDVLYSGADSNLRGAINNSNSNVGDAIVIKNCRVVNCRATYLCCGINLAGSTRAHYAYNNSVASCTSVGADGYGIRASVGSVLKNNMSVYNKTGDYDGDHSASDTGNLSSDATVPSTGTYYASATPSFVNYNSGTMQIDTTDTVCKGKGVNLYADANVPMLVDYLGNPRPNAAQTIGAHEPVTASSSIIYKRKSFTGVW
jgi:hypothetical protein